MVRVLWTLAILLVLFGTQQAASAVPICNSNDLRLFNPKLASGDDAPALLAADASPSTTYIYADKVKANSVLNVLKSITLQKPLVTGRFLSVRLGAGVVLTLKSQPRFPRGRIISGPGRIQLSGPGPFWVLPEWWMGSNSNSDHSVALAAAKQACAGTVCNIIATGQMKLSSTLTLTPELRMWGSARASITGTTSDAVVMGPGTYTSPLTLPYFTGLKGSALTLHGVRGLTAYVPMVSSGGTGVQLKTSAAGNAITGTNVDAFFITGVKQGYWVNTRAGDSLASSSLYSNFLSNAASGASSGLYFSGGAPALKSFSVQFSAVDAANKAATFAIVRSAVANAVNDVIVGVTAWAGGFNQGVSLVDGRFNNLSMEVKLSGTILSRMLSFVGAASRISWLASWNRSSPKEMTIVRTKNPPVSDMITANYSPVMLPSKMIVGKWEKGASRKFYVNHLMANGGSTRILLGPGRMPYTVDFLVNPGIVVASVKDVGSYNIEITLQNSSGRTLSVKDVTLPNGRSYDLYFNLMVGVGGIR